MKKYLLLAAVGLSITTLQAQEVSDALRYSQDNLTGTARFRALSGAFGALGGDLSSLNVNPAGSAIFANNQMTVSLSNFGTKNNSNYFGQISTEKNNTFDINQAGAVFVFDNNSNSNWRKIALAVNYENTNNFDNGVFSAGTNPTNSIDRYFLAYANRGNNGAPVPQQFVNREPGESITDLYSFLGSNLPSNQFPGLSGFDAQQAFLGYQSFLLEAVDANNPNSAYFSTVPGGGNYFQTNEVYSTGYNGKLSFNLSSSYKDKLYIGLNLNSHFTDYSRTSSFTERNNAPLTSDYTVSRLRFNNDLNTYGTGFSFQLGSIAKLSNEIRVGLAYESSTWYNLTDELSQSLSVVSANTAEELPAEDIAPQVVNVYAPYKLQTPSKLTGSFAYVFGKKGLISVDYAVKNYANTQFKPTNDFFFNSLNNEMNRTLDNSSEVRIGGEYKIERLSLRGGYRYEQSPYADNTTIGNLNGFSGGLGYNFGSTKLDLAYAYAKRNLQQQFFSNGFTDGSNIDAINSTVTLTLLFEL